tara:strand:+ start:756 stop:1418 length:663 start_codon:yes stop_codon:yes gene_type:complete
MRIIEVIKDFLKVFIMIKGKRNPNYHKRVKKFSQNKNQIAEKKIISKILKKQKLNRILDFGCNDGLLNKYLNNNINYWGVDNNKEIKKEPKLHSKNIKIIKKKIPFKNGFFDCVVLSHVIAHIENPYKLIRNLEKKLRTKGIFIIISPNKSYKFFYSFLNIFNNYNPDTTIYKYYSSLEIKKKFLKNYKILNTLNYSIKKGKIRNSLINSRFLIVFRKIK